MSKNVKRVPNPAGLNGPVYTESQLEKAIIARAGGMSWKATAKMVGIKSPAYLAKLLRGGVAEAGLDLAL
jgi:hypothetical protein